MDKQIDTRRLKQEVQIIYNNDCKIVDFLSDLHDREPVRALHRYLSFGARDNACLLFNCKEDKLYVLVLYNAPFGFNEGDNHLMIYSHMELIALCRYFREWSDNTNPFNKAKHKAIDDILRVLYYNWAMQNSNSPDEFPG